MKLSFETSMVPHHPGPHLPSCTTQPPPPRLPGLGQQNIGKGTDLKVEFNEKCSVRKKRRKMRELVVPAPDITYCLPKTTPTLYTFIIN